MVFAVSKLLCALSGSTPAMVNCFPGMEKCAAAITNCFSGIEKSVLAIANYPVGIEKSAAEVAGSHPALAASAPIVPKHFVDFLHIGFRLAIHTGILHKLWAVFFKWTMVVAARRYTAGIGRRFFAGRQYANEVWNSLCKPVSRRRVQQKKYFVRQQICGKRFYVRPFAISKSHCKPSPFFYILNY